MLQCEAKVPKNQRSTIEIELTWKVRTLATEISGHGCMAGFESVVLAQSCDRLGVLAVTTKLLAIHYQLCFFPPPALMMASLESGTVAGSQVSP